MWLMKSLQPDHNTISNFRKDNPKALKKAFRATVSVAKHFDLIGGVLIAGDSTKFRAQNSKKNNFNQAKMYRHFKYIDNKLNEYYSSLNAADEYNIHLIQNEINTQLNRKQNYLDIQDQLLASGQTQISTSDPDSRQLIIRNNITETAYNVQTPLANGSYTVTVDFSWHWLNDSTSYSVHLPYQVGVGGVNWEDVVVVATAIPIEVNSGYSSQINYFSSNANSCQIENVLEGTIIGEGCPVSGSFYTGPLFSNTSTNKLHKYRVTCGAGSSWMIPPMGYCTGSWNGGGGSTAFNIIPKNMTSKPESYSAKIKNFLSQITPKVLAEQTVPAGYAEVNILGKFVAPPPPPPPPSPIVTLEKKPSQIKNTIKKSDPTWRGTVYFCVHVEGPPTGQGCTLKNTADPSYYRFFANDEIAKEVYKSELSASVNNFWQIMEIAS